MKFEIFENQNENYSEYKKFHESFMQNNHGSTAVHTFFCIFFTVQCTIYCSMKNLHGISQIIYEYVFIVLSLICAHTIFTDHIYLLNFTLTILILSEFALNYGKFKWACIKNDIGLQDKKHKSVTCMRGLTYLITVFCILAVDFKDFPRYLAKTEDYGYSLMDTGVGLFVIMSGLVHKDINKDNLCTVVKKNFNLMFILSVLGVARYISIKNLNYQEHVTEYGVHWNFFFTLAICKFLSSILIFLSSNILVTTVFIMTIHELLMGLSLEKWVFSNTPRNTFLNANREGIASCLGYVSLYMFAACVKFMLNDKSSSREKITYKFILSIILFWTLTYLFNLYRPASRTLANAAYCSFLCAVFMTVLTILFIFETYFKNNGLSYKVPFIVSTVNNNGLVYFLLANLMTGSINMCTKTLLLNTETTFIVLNCYMMLTILATWYFNVKHIRI